MKNFNNEYNKILNLGSLHERNYKRTRKKKGENPFNHHDGNRLNFNRIRQFFILKSSELIETKKKANDKTLVNNKNDGIS